MSVFTIQLVSTLAGIQGRDGGVSCSFGFSVAPVKLCEQTFLDALGFKSPPFLQRDVQCVEEGTERGVEGQHEDGHGHADLARDGSATGGQQTQQAGGSVTGGQQTQQADGSVTGDQHTQQADVSATGGQQADGSATGGQQTQQTDGSATGGQQTQ